MKPIDADEIVKYCTDKSDDTYKSRMFVEFMACIDEMPTLDVEPVKYGKWISFNTYDAFKCSKCGRVEFNKEPYCHCGAKMV